MPSNHRNAAIAQDGSRRFVLLVLLPVLLLFAALALAPASAMAGDTGGDGPCSATVTADDDPRIATFDLDCGDGNDIATATLRTNEENEGSVEGDDDTDCEEQTNREFTCTPTDPASSIGGRFTIDGDDQDVCVEPRLQIDFEVDFDDGSMEEVNDVVVEGCPSDSGSGGDEDSGTTPEGGVDSGFGGTAKAASTTTLPLAGAGLAFLVLVSAGLLVRRTRTTP